MLHTSPIKNYFPVKTVSTSKRRTSIFPSVWETMYSITAMLKAKKLDCDIIHLLNVTKETYLVLYKMLKINKTCISHLYHSSFPFSGYSNFKLRLLLMKLGFYEHVFCSNKSLVDFLIKKNVLRAENVHYIPSPIDIKQFRPRNKQKLREKYCFPVDAPIIFYVGQIDPERGFFIILKAFKKILRNLPDAILYICHPNLKGEEKVYAPFFKSICCKNMKKNIVISGPNVFIEESYSLSDVVVLPFQKPYWITAPPLVLIEAMASATPIVTTPLDVIKEIGRNKENMIFSTPNNVDSLVNSIFYILNNTEEATKIGLKAREHVIQNFSMNKVGLSLKEAYKNIHQLQES